MDERIKQALIETVGEKNYTDSLIDMVSFSYDASEHSHRPLCAVWPSSAEEVSKILIFCAGEKIPVIPRGAGTGLSGMAVPIQGGVILDLSRMNRIVRISIEDRLAVVEPGVVYADLEKALEPFGFFFPPDPASGKVSTLGGNVATNAGGLKGAKYGTTRDYVLGLQVVLPDGRIMRTGSKAMKSVSGYDLTRIFVGSEGTLGVVTEVTLKINPKPTASSTALATFDSLEDAGRAINQIMHSGIIPSALEILGRETLAAINENTDLNLPEVDAMLLAETDGYTREETDYQIRKVIGVFEDNNAREVKQARTDKEVEDLWAARKSAYAVLARIKSHFVLEDVTVPMTNIAKLLEGIAEISERYGLKIATFGHAGDGNIHVNVLRMGAGDTTWNEELPRAIEEIFRLTVSLGGTISGEHGIGYSQRRYLPIRMSERELELQRTIKTALDPRGILNPGKIFPD